LEEVLRFLHGELNESGKIYTLKHGQGTFEGQDITWHPRGRKNQSDVLHTPHYAKLHRVTYDLILPRDVELGCDEFKPEIPRGCTRICGEAKSLKISSGSSILLHFEPRKNWKITFWGSEKWDRISSIWEVSSS
jgi:hypothetical protein